MSAPADLDAWAGVTVRRLILVCATFLATITLVLGGGIAPASATSGFSLSFSSFSRDQETGSISFTANVDVNGLTYQTCGMWHSNCVVYLLAETAHDGEMQFATINVDTLSSSSYTKSDTWNGWYEVERIKAVYGWYAPSEIYAESDWVDIVDDNVRAPGLSLQIPEWYIDPATGDAEYTVRAETQAFFPACGSFSCPLKIIGENALGGEDVLTTFAYSTWTITNFYHNVFTESATWSGSLPIVRIQARIDSFKSQWIDVTDLRLRETIGGFNASEKNCVCSHADPVNTRTGEFFLPVTDLTLPGAGPAIETSRTYSSAMAIIDGPFGNGWAASFSSSLDFVVPGDVSDPMPAVIDVIQENGATARFARQLDGTYTAASRVFAALTYDDVADEWTFTRQGVEVFNFDDAGLLTSRTDPNGNEVAFDYESGKLATISGSGGRSISLTWSGDHITNVEDSAGRSVDYTYDVDDNLTSVEAVDGAETTYDYDSGHLMTSFTRPGGGVTENEYDTSGRVVSQLDPLDRETTFSYSGNVTSTTGWDGAITTETYVDGRVVEQTRAAGTALAATIYFEYDDAGNVLEQTDPLGNTTSYTYDGRGNPLSKTDALEQTSSWTYNGLNRITSSTDPLERVTSMTYDEFGNLLTQTSPGMNVTTYTVNVDGTVASVEDPRGMVTSFTYDSAGRLTSSTDPDARTTGASYDSAGQITTRTDAGGSVTTYTRDAAGRVLLVNDPLDHETSYVYDEDGNLLSTENANGDITSTTYDVAGQVTSSTDGRGKTTTFTYSDGGYLETVTDPDLRTSTRAHDLLGQLVTSADGASNTTTYTYDASGRLLSTVLPSTSTSSTEYDEVGQVVATTDGNGNVTSYTYDAAGRVTSVTDPLFRVTETSYNDDGQVDTVTLPDLSSKSYTYNENGQVAAFTDPDGYVTSYVYGDSGLLAQKTAPGDIVTSYDYNTTGQLEVVTLPDLTTITNSYDDAGRLVLRDYSAIDTTDVSFTYDAIGARLSMTDETGTTTYTYDENGQLTSETNGASQALDYAYTDSGLLETITYPGADDVDYTYDAAGRMASVTDWNSNTTTYAWTVDGLLASQSSPNDVVQSRTYDAAGQLLDVLTVDPLATIAEYEYAYDDAGQLTTETTTDALLAGIAQTYSYDPVGQLASSTDGLATTTYVATSGGQLTTFGGSTLSYDSSQRLTEVTSAGSDFTYQFDANGSRTQETLAASGPDPAMSTSYAYDAGLNLRAVVMPGETEATVTYSSNGDGLRQTRTTTETTQFLWSTAGSLPLLVGDDDYRYVYGVNSTPIEQVASSGDATYLHADLLGSVRLLTDDSGAIDATTAYDAYGNVDGHLGAGTSTFGYTGATTDSVTGLVYLRARDYDPSTGQFMTADPAVELTRQPYAYVANNPLTRVDPDGLRYCPASGGPCYEDPLYRSNRSHQAYLAAELYDCKVAIVAANLDRHLRTLGWFEAGARWYLTTGADLTAATTPLVSSMSGLRLGGVSPSVGAKLAELDTPASVRTFQTYTKTNPLTGEVYSGRTSGYGTPLENIQARDSGHAYNSQGFGPAVLDRTSTSASAIRGREQQLIDWYRGLGISANKINGVSPSNPRQQDYLDAAINEFGGISPR